MVKCCFFCFCTSKIHIIRVIDKLSFIFFLHKSLNLGKKRLENQLFISINGSENIKNSLLHMFKAIRKLNSEILHPKQIRASVITYWLKNYNLRQVQYMAGRKYVSSTERYQLNNLDSLQKALEKYHPLK